MPEIAYTVTARCDSEQTLRSYVEWLTSGHIQAVLRGGATRARVIRSADADDPRRVEVRYDFPTQEAFETYVADHAPALRAEGLERFGPGSGVEFVRSLGRIEADLAAKSANI
jgi:hypothetical protein